MNEQEMEKFFTELKETVKLSQTVCETIVSLREARKIEKEEEDKNGKRLYFWNDPTRLFI